MLIIVWILLSIVLMAFIEYSIHRWLMHDRKFWWTRLSFFAHIHNQHKFLHHRKYYKKFDYEPDPYGKTLDIKISIVVSTIILGVLLIPVAMFLSLEFALIMLATLIVHHLLWNTIHQEMHIPQRTWFSRFRIYRWLARYHYLHHIYPGKNFQVVIPIFDYLFGTNIKARPKDIQKMKELGLL